MTIAASAKPKDVVADHLSVLRSYARKMASEGEPLSVGEDADRAARVEEFMAIGLAYRCTPKELVSLLYADVFRTRRGCDCYSCKRRRMLADRRYSRLEA